MSMTRAAGAAPPGRRSWRLEEWVSPGAVRPLPAVGERSRSLHRQRVSSLQQCLLLPNRLVVSRIEALAFRSIGVNLACVALDSPVYHRGAYRGAGSEFKNLASF